MHDTTVGAHSVHTNNGSCWNRRPWTFRLWLWFALFWEYEKFIV